MNRIPRMTAWWGLLAAGAVGLLPACDGGETTGPGGTGGSTTTATGGGGSGGTAGSGGTGGDAGQGGGGGTAGNGGGGGAPTGKPDGDPCTADAECENGFCLTQELFGWPYGACTGACNSFIECAAGSTCSEVANNPFCLKLCATNDDCKQGKLCTDIGGGESVCLPNCTTDDECAGYGSCDETTGDCTPDENCDLPGDENDNALTDCEDGACVTTATCLPLITTACDAATPVALAAGQTVVANGDTTGKTSLFGGYCAGGGNGEDIREITIPANVAGLLELELVATTADLVLYTRAECGNDSSSLCIDELTEGPLPEVLRRSVTGPQTVWAFVDGSTYGSPKEGAYTLTTTMYQAQPESEPNNDVATADPVSPTLLASLATGTLDQATDDDDWFLLDTSMLVGNKTITVETIGNAGSGCAPDAGDVDTFVEVLSEDGMTVLGDSEDISFSNNWCSLVSLSDLPPAKYLVHATTSPFCVPDVMGPDCTFPYAIKIRIQ